MKIVELLVTDYKISMIQVIKVIKESVKIWKKEKILLKKTGKFEKNLEINNFSGGENNSRAENN